MIEIEEMMLFINNSQIIMQMSQSPILPHQQHHNVLVRQRNDGSRLSEIASTSQYE